MFEMLSLYEDALVQYDELDALFTQFILNHAAGGENDRAYSNLIDISCLLYNEVCFNITI